MGHPKLVLLLLRLGLASVFLYAAIASFITPDNWIGYFPAFLRMIFPGQLLLTGFSSFEVILSIWILSGWKSFWAGLFASLTLLGIILANISELDILFRDIAILFAALALAVSAKKS